MTTFHILLFFNCCFWFAFILYWGWKERRAEKHRKDWRPREWWPAPQETSTPVFPANANCPNCHSNSTVERSIVVTCSDCSHNFQRMLPDNTGMENFGLDDIGTMLDTLRPIMSEPQPKPVRSVALRRYKNLIVEDDL